MMLQSYLDEDRRLSGPPNSPPPKVFLNLRGTKMTFSIFSILGDWEIESYPIKGVWILRRLKYVHVFEAGFFLLCDIGGAIWSQGWGIFLLSEEQKNTRILKITGSFFGRGPALWMAKGNWRSQWFAGCLSWWWFYNMFYFSPHPWGNDPNWRAYFKCSNGLVQPPTSSLVFQNPPNVFWGGVWTP